MGATGHNQGRHNHACASLVGIDIDGREALVRGDRYMRDERIQLVNAVLVLVALSRQSHAHAKWHITNALRPHKPAENENLPLRRQKPQNALVKLGVDAHILGTHLLCRELLDLLDRATGAILETDAVNALVHVNRVLSRHDLQR